MISQPVTITFSSGGRWRVLKYLIGLVLAWLIIGERNDFVVNGAMVFASIFLSGFAFIIILAMRRKITLSEDGIHDDYVFSRKKFVAWSEIRQSEIAFYRRRSLTKRIDLGREGRNLTVYGEMKKLARPLQALISRCGYSDREPLLEIFTCYFLPQDINAIIKAIKENSAIETVDLTFEEIKNEPMVKTD